MRENCKDNVVGLGDLYFKKLVYFIIDKSRENENKT